MSEHEVSWKCEDSPPWSFGQRMLGSTRLDTRPPNASSVEDTSCLGRFWTRSRAANWHLCKLPDHSPEFGRRMVIGCGAARRAFETMDTSRRLKTCASQCSSICSHTGDCERRAGLCVAEGQEKPNRRTDCTCYPSVVWSSHCGWQRKEQCVRFLPRFRDKCCTGLSPKGQRG